MNESLDKNNRSMRDRLSDFANRFGLPRLIIAAFLLLLYIAAPFVGAGFWMQISNTINRFSWNAVMVLAMVPMIHSGCGLNFGLPLGILSGLLGATLSIELGFTGPMSFVMAILIATPFALVLGAAFGWRSRFAFWKDDLVYEGESVYNYLQVEETEDSVILSTNVLFGVQSILPKNARFTGMYYDYAMAAPYMAGAAEKAAADEDLDLLVLGMGSGTFGSQCAACLPGLSVEGVEIDGKITRLAREYFAMPDELPVAEYDGRAWLNAVDRRYDVIMVDAYQDITIPFQMASVEFFTMVREHLKDDGVMVVNMNMRGSGEGSINAYLADTISAVFPAVWTVDVPRNTNRELFASGNADMIARLEKNIAMLEDGELRELLTKVSSALTRYEAGEQIMTDDRAPVELLSMRVIDELIRDEVAYYKDIYEQYGLEGVIGSL